MDSHYQFSNTTNISGDRNVDVQTGFTEYVNIENINHNTAQVAFSGGIIIVGYTCVMTDTVPQETKENITLLEYLNTKYQNFKVIIHMSILVLRNVDHKVKLRVQHLI